MTLCHPTYSLKVTIQDRDPPIASFEGMGITAGAAPRKKKYFNSLEQKTGCDEILADVKAALLNAGIKADVWFEKFEHSA